MFAITPRDMIQVSQLKDPIKWFKKKIKLLEKIEENF